LPQRRRWVTTVPRIIRGSPLACCSANVIILHPERAYRAALESHETLARLNLGQARATSATKTAKVHQKEHEQIFPTAGWVEHNASRNQHQVVWIPLTGNELRR